MPFAVVDGVWTLDDSVLEAVAKQAQADGRFQTVFYEGHITTPYDFVEIMKQPTNLPVFVFRGTEPIGVAWLNGMAGNRAFAHFCMLSTAKGREPYMACRMILDYWMSFANAGEPVLDILIGVIPHTNDKAVSFVEALGFARLGQIPHMLLDLYTGDRAAAVILYYSRFEHHGRR